jgi:polyhydroxyalkanoate synthase subunit PhaC
MSDVSTETQVVKKFDPEAFAINLARAMETSGKSAIDVEQPPSASADASSTPKANVRFFRCPDIRSEVPIVSFPAA